MVQGSNKLSGGRPGAIKKINSAKLKRQEFNSKKVKLGAPKQLPKNHFRAEAIEDRQITKAIGKVIEQKVAAKVIQSGGKVGLKDIMKQGKELNKEIRRSQLKRKKTRVEEKLTKLEELAEKQGIN